MLDFISCKIEKLFYGKIGEFCEVVNARDLCSHGSQLKSSIDFIFSLFF